PRACHTSGRLFETLHARALNELTGRQDFGKRLAQLTLEGRILAANVEHGNAHESSSTSGPLPATVEISSTKTEKPDEQSCLHREKVVHGAKEPDKRIGSGRGRAVAGQGERSECSVDG